MTKKHYSDCAVHNEPAYPKGDCDCGGYEDISEIEALRAENARLREENERFRKLHDEMLLMANTVTAEVKAREKMGENDAP